VFVHVTFVQAACATTDPRHAANRCTWDDRLPRSALCERLFVADKT
jgi:hypothetical protein